MMEISAILNKLISDRTGIETNKILPQSQFDEDLNLSKIELAEFLNFIEDYFKINLRLEETAKIETVDDLRNIIEDHLNEL